MDVELAILFGWSVVVCLAVGVAARLQANNRKAIKEVSLKVREINIRLNAVMDKITKMEEKDGC